MRVLFVMNLASEYGGNVMASVDALCRRLEERGDECEFLFPEAAKGRPWTASLAPRTVSFAPFRGLPFARSLMETRRRCGTGTLVYAHFLNPLQLTLTRLTFPLVVNHFHMTLRPRRTPIDLAKDAYKTALYHTLTTIAVSPAVERALATRLHLDGRRLRCIPNAVDFDAPRMTTRSGDSPFAELCDESDFVVGMFGTHYERKGVDIAALALEELGDSYILVILAHDVQSTCMKIDSLQMNHAMVCVLPVIENVGEFYDSIDLFVSPSRAEAFCYAVVEAAWSRCQVAASLVSGQDCLQVIPGSIWFAPESPTALASAIREAAARMKSGRLDEINASQRAFVERHYSIGVWVTHVISALDETYGKAEAS